MNLEAHYRVLGLAPGSPLALVKKTYLREIKTWHPDRYAPNSSLREAAEERTKALTAAYAALRAAGDDRGDEATAATMGRKPTSGAASHDRPSGWQWFGRFWQSLRARRPPRPEASGPATAKQRLAKGAAGGRREKRRKASTFNQILDEARGPSRSASTPGSAATWRRLAAKRSRYRSRRGNSGANAIDPISSRGPVTPVRPIRPIGKDG